MTCPKCESKNVVAAPDEAPRAALQWMKCFACGKRWDQSGRMLRELNEENDREHGEVIEMKPVKRSGDDLVALVMKVARQHPSTQKKEQPMRAWSPEARERHKKVMQQVHAKKREGGGSAVRKQSKRLGRPPKNAVAIVTPSPVMPTPIRRMDLTGNVLTVLAGAVEQKRHEIAVLEEAQEILSQ